MKVTLNEKTLKALPLNGSVDFAKGDLKNVEVLMKEITTSNAAYSYHVVQKSPRIFTITRVLPQSFADRAVYFDTIGKRQIQRAMKAYENVKTHAAAALNMSPRTLRRRIAELELSY